VQETGVASHQLCCTWHLCILAVFISAVWSRHLSVAYPAAHWTWVTGFHGLHSCPHLMAGIIFRLYEARPYILLVCFICLLFIFLPPELIDRERPEGHPLFSYHRWGPWTCSIKIDRNSSHPFHIFYNGAKNSKFWPKFQYHSCSECHHFELEDFFGNLIKTCQGLMAGHTSWYPPGWGE